MGGGVDRRDVRPSRDPAPRLHRLGPPTGGPDPPAREDALSAPPGVRQQTTAPGRAIAGRSSRRPGSACSSPAGRSSSGARESGAGCCSAPSSSPRGPGPGLGDVAVLGLPRLRLPRPRQLDHRCAPPGFVPRLFAAHRRTDDRGLAGDPPHLPALLTLVDTAWPGSAPDRTRSVYLVNCWAYRMPAPGAGHWVWLHRPPRAGSMRPASSPSPGRRSSGPVMNGRLTA